MFMLFRIYKSYRFGFRPIQVWSLGELKQCTSNTRVDINYSIYWTGCLLVTTRRWFEQLWDYHLKRVARILIHLYRRNRRRLFHLIRDQVRPLDGLPWLVLARVDRGKLSTQYAVWQETSVQQHWRIYHHGCYHPYWLGEPKKVETFCRTKRCLRKTLLEAISRTLWSGEHGSKLQGKKDVFWKKIRSLAWF